MRPAKPINQPAYAVIFTLAIRNLLADRLRFITTLAGVTIAIVLMAGQMAIYLGASRLITSLIDHASADLWIMPLDCQSFEDGMPVLGRQERHAALAVPGVRKVEPLIATFADWYTPNGGLNSVVLIGVELEGGGLAPWNVTSDFEPRLGRLEDVVVDEAYLSDLGVGRIGATAKVETRIVRIGALTRGIRSFTQSPYVFAQASYARSIVGAPADAASFLLVTTEKNADVESVQAVLSRVMRRSEALTGGAFRRRSLERWLFGSGAGFALIGGTILSVLIAVAVVVQTLTMSIHEHETEFAILRAMGSSVHYLRGIVLLQVALLMTLSLTFALPCVAALINFSAMTPLPMFVTPRLTAVILLISVCIGLFAAFGALRKVRTLDPVTLFRSGH